MPKFYYKARAKTGGVIQGEVEAADPWLARKALAAENLIVLEVSNFGLRAALSWLKELRERFGNRVTLEEKLMFVNQLETGLSIGIPILQVLGLISDQTKNRFLKETLVKIRDDVSQGSSLYAAFEKHPVVFDSTALGLIRAGEVTGELEATLARLAKIIEQSVKNRAKIKSATFYPKIVIVFMVFTNLVIVYFVIPKFKTFLASLGMDLPLVTQLVLKVSDFCISYWYLLLGVGLGAVWAFKAYYATGRGRIKVDGLKLKAPIIGQLLLDLELNNYCVLLDLLLESGLTLFESFETLKETQSNQIIRNEIDRSAAEISKGSSLGAALRASEVFPNNFTSMISVGEESGRIATVLQKLAKYYQIQVDYRLDTLSKLIEPILLFFIFIMVGTLAFAVFLPIWKMSQLKH